MNAPSPAVAQVDERAIERFLFREARLQDESRYDEWEALWADDALYWVPTGLDDDDPAKVVAIIYDNRARIAQRVRQLNSLRRFSQAPVSQMRRVIGNVEIEDVGEAGVRVGSNFVLLEARNERRRLWGGRCVHLLRPFEDSYRMVMKKVILIDRDQPIETLAFLI